LSGTITQARRFLAVADSRPPHHVPPARRCATRGAAAVTAVAAAIGTGAVLESAGAAPHSATVGTAATAKGKIALLPDDGTDMQTLGDNAKAAGAVAALVYEAAPDAFPHYGISLGVPVFYVTLDEANKALAKTAKGPFTLAWVSTPDSPFVYNLAFHDTNRVSAGQKHQVHDANLAEVSENWSSLGTPTRMPEDEVVSRPWNPSGGLSLGNVFTAAPFNRTAYFSPALTSAALSYSYDGGATWTTAPTNQVNGQWIASVDHTGAAGKTVTVKLTLGAADGTSVTQTVVDAYGVK
jgi:hypothetical protein